MSERLTPEEAYDHYREQLVTGIERHVFDALRDMIASLDAELARLTETVNRLERQIDWNAG